MPVQPVAAPERPGPTPNFITFDIEEWFHVNYEGITIPQDAPGNVEPLTDTFLALCDDAHVRCTFFVLGSVAQKHPALVRRIHERGHEVASHSYLHKSVRTLSPAEFKEDTRRSLDTLENITGEKVVGYRAPSFSVTRENAPWYYQTLHELGFLYSSSVFPGQTFLYGIPGFPRHPHRPALAAGANIIEFPISRINLLHLTIPLYLRLFPAAFLRRVIAKRSAQGQPSMLYLHPREIDPHQPRLPLKGLERLVHYWGVNGCEKNLRNLLRNPASFSRIRDVVNAFA
jgi:polysaccharide deacetylase family protein (PEP-CTERM system associated)